MKCRLRIIELAGSPSGQHAEIQCAHLTFSCFRLLTVNGRPIYPALLITPLEFKFTAVRSFLMPMAANKLNSCLSKACNDCQKNSSIFDYFTTY